MSHVNLDNHRTCSCEISRTLGRIESICEENSRRIILIEEKLQPIFVDLAVAKTAGAREGRKWGAIVGAAVAALMEVGRRFVL